jgi:hypothetical protein
MISIGRLLFIQFSLPKTARSSLVFLASFLDSIKRAILVNLLIITYIKDYLFEIGSMIIKVIVIGFYGEEKNLEV